MVSMLLDLLCLVTLDMAIVMVEMGMAMVMVMRQMAKIIMEMIIKMMMTRTGNRKNR